MQWMLMCFMIPDAVYISVQMLEIHPNNCHFRHFLGAFGAACRRTVRSARHCSITRSDMNSAEPGHPKTEWV
jgi:hypothetical protein